jgi:hypothetical protein
MLLTSMSRCGLSLQEKQVAGWDSNLSAEPFSLGKYEFDAIKFSQFHSA